MDEREEFLARRRQRREQTFVDFAGTLEFANLREDLQEALSEDAPEFEGPTVSAAPAGRLEAFGLMGARANIFAASNAVADVRNLGRDTADMAVGRFRGRVANLALEEERAAYTPTDEEVVAVAEKYGLGPESYGKLVDWAASPEDLDNVGLGLASLRTRDYLIEDSVGPVDGFLMDFAANALQPEFLVLGGVAGKAFQVGTSLTRVSSALRGAAAGAAADAPLEILRAADSPYYSYADAALATTLSIGLGAAVGAAGAGLLSPDDLINVQRLDAQTAELYARLSRGETLESIENSPEYRQLTKRQVEDFASVRDRPLQEAVPEQAGAVPDTLSIPGSGGAAAFNRVSAGPLEIGDEGWDAPERLGFTFGWTPAGALWRSEDPGARTMIDDLTVNPWRDDQGETLFEMSNRFNESGGFFIRQADDAMRAYWRENAGGMSAAATGTVERLTAPVTRLTGGVTDAQASEFYIEVGQVIAGIRQTTDPNVRRAAESFADGFEDGLYYMQDSNYPGWIPGVARPEPTGRSIPEAADIVPNRNYLPLTPHTEGFYKVRESFLPAGSLRASRDNPENIRIAHERMGDRVAEVLLRSEENVAWVTELASRWNAGRANTPNAAGIVADPMTPERMAQRIGRKYIDTWSRLAQRELDDTAVGVPQRAMTVADRNAVKEIVEEIFEDGSELNANLREEIIESVLDIVAPAKRRTSADSPRLMNRLDLRYDAVADRDIIGIYNWDASQLFKDYRRHVAGRAALLRKGYDGPDDFARRADEVVARAEATGPDALRKADKERRLLLEGLAAVTGDGRYGTKLDPFFRGMKFVTQGIARMNVAAFLSNTALGPMFAEYGGVLFAAQHRLFTRIPAYNAFLKAARKGDVEGMKGGFLLADVVGGHGSGLARARGTARNRFDAGLDDVTSSGGRLAGAYDEITRKAANATGRWSGMTAVNDYLRAISMISDIEDWSKGKLTAFQRKQAGLSPDMWARVQNLLKDLPMTTGSQSGQPVLDDIAFMQRAGAADPEAFNALMAALNRRARRLVQDPDWGHAPEWIRRPIFDLIFQFFNYPINAINKQVVPFGRAIAARDPQVLQTTMQAFFAGIGYANRVYLQSLTKEDPAAYREERLTRWEIGKAMFYYSTVSSLAPNLFDGLVDGASAVAPDAVRDIEERIGTKLKFSYTRASGLAASPWTGNPTYTRVDSILRSSARLLRGDDPEGSAERLATALIPLGNSIYGQLLINTMFEPLPGDDDENQ